MKSIAGGTALDPGGPTFPDSVIVISGARIHTIGSAPDTKVPSGSALWSTKDRFIIPAPVELIQGVRMTRIDTLADAKAALIKVPDVVEGIVTDSDELPSDLVTRFMRAETIVVPRLARLADAPDRLARALLHVKRLADAGVRIASFADREALPEWRLLTRAGLTARQVLESATMHAARVVRLHDSAGGLRAGFLANIWILRLDPLQQADNLSSVESIMIEGLWQNSVERKKK